MSPTPVQTVLLLGGTYTLIALLRRIFSRSALDNIPGPPSASFLLGNVLQYHNPDGWDFQQDLEENYGAVVKLSGFLGSKMLYVFDTAALHSIVIKEHDIYEQAPIAIRMNQLMFGKGIFSTLGDDHRRLRKMMMPAFSTANLRGMMGHFYGVAEALRDGLIAPQVVNGPREVELASLLTRTSLELIGRSGIGYSFDPMVMDAPVNEYTESIKQLLPTLHKIPLLLPFVPLASKFGPPSFRRFLLNAIPSPTLHRLRDMVDLMDNTAREILQGKKIALQRGDLESKENMETGNDLMSIMLRNNMDADGTLQLTDGELLAQTSAIIFAAMDTTSSALTRLVHLLAIHQDVQNKLRTEILNATAGTEDGRLDHDAVVELPYLDAFIRETLRLYPPASPGMIRETIAATTLPLSTPITGKDGSTITAIPVPKGTTVYIGIPAANHRRDIWGEDALEFKPERWANGRAGREGEKMPGVYSGTMTFIGGGRSCVGFKFSQLEMKVVLCVLLSSFKFSESDKEIKYKMGSVTTSNVDGRLAMPLVVERV
ncbi:cytochrome P450 [Mycena sp. CBHHK59/15]|nr:cytochrome P450 [Mycena sp. CBHHK59/15]